VSPHSLPTLRPWQSLDWKDHKQSRRWLLSPATARMFFRLRQRQTTPIRRNSVGANGISDIYLSIVSRARFRVALRMSMKRPLARLVTDLSLFCTNVCRVSGNIHAFPELGCHEMKAIQLLDSLRERAIAPFPERNRSLTCIHLIWILDPKC
jgi:hypothetical protein